MNKLNDSVVKTDSKAKIQQKLKYQMDKGKELVTGIFHFHDAPGGILEFPLKLYPGESIKRWSFLDGKTYKIPMSVAKHLSTSGWYPVYKHTETAEGSPLQVVSSKRQRYSFQSLEFIDPVDFDTVDAGLITVENI